MNKQMKLNAVENLMESLEFNREEKEALLHMLQQELDESASPDQHPVKKAPPQEYGEFLPMTVLFDDGTTGRYRDRVKKIVGIVIEGAGRRFALHSAQHCCPFSSPLSDAMRYAENKLSRIDGKAWRVLTVSDCQIIYNQFRNVQRMLGLVSHRKIEESNIIGVLTSDGSMAGHQGWQVWFALDL